MNDPTLQTDASHERRLTDGSKALLTAVTLARQGRPTGTCHDLIWREYRDATNFVPPPDMASDYAQKQVRLREMAARGLLEREQVIARAVHRDPCTRCGVRGDLHADFGCKEANRKQIANPTADQVNQAWEAEVAQVFAGALRKDAA